MLDDYKRGFNVGTFDIGDTVYYTGICTHRFWIPADCPYCSTTGHIEFKGKIFSCPECHGKKNCIAVQEKVIEDSHKIYSKITMISSNGAKEIYYTDEFLGVVICLQEDGECRYFKSKQEAQQVCDEFNIRNNVFEQLRFYKEKELQ